MSPKSIIFLLFVFLSSCAISINENDYRFLSKSDKLHFKKYSSNPLISVLPTKLDHDSIAIYEICTPNIKNLIRRNKFTLVRIWAPYCKGESCSTILSSSMYLKDKYSSNGFDVILISNSYSLKDINKSITNSKFTLPLFVLSDSCYGSKQGKAMKQFAMDVDNNNILKRKEYFSSYFFKDTILVKASWEFTVDDIDSLINQYKFNH